LAEKKFSEDKHSSLFVWSVYGGVKMFLTFALEVAEKIEIKSMFYNKK
jgi:hypothetical protein